jgi:hypothetical protein
MISLVPPSGLLSGAAHRGGRLMECRIAFPPNGVEVLIASDGLALVSRVFPPSRRRWRGRRRSGGRGNAASSRTALHTPID